MASKSRSPSRFKAAGGLVELGSGTLALSGSNAYSGGTTVYAGVLQLGNAHALGSGPLAVNSSATLDLHGYGASVTSLSGSGTILNAAGGTSSPAVLAVTAGGTFYGDIQDGGLGGTNRTGLTLAGGLLILAGSDNYSEGTLVSGGTLVAVTPTALPYGSVTVAPGGTLIYDPSQASAQQPR